MMLWFLKPGVTLSYVIMRLLSILLIIFLILPLHEFAHGYVANKLGDKTSKHSGRLTLNPLYHIDPIGVLVMFLFGFGWAKPVPIDPRNFKNPKVGMALTAIAGPISNISIVLLSRFSDPSSPNTLTFITLNSPLFLFPAKRVSYVP